MFEHTLRWTLFLTRIRAFSHLTIRISILVREKPESVGRFPLFSPHSNHLCLFSHTFCHHTLFFLRFLLLHFSCDAHGHPNNLSLFICAPTHRRYSATFEWCPKTSTIGTTIFSRSYSRSCCYLGECDNRRWSSVVRQDLEDSLDSKELKPSLSGRSCRTKR